MMHRARQLAAVIVQPLLVARSLARVRAHQPRHQPQNCYIGLGNELRLFSSLLPLIFCHGTAMNAAAAHVLHLYLNAEWNSTPAEVPNGWRQLPPRTRPADDGPEAGRGDDRHDGWEGM